MNEKSTMPPKPISESAIQQQCVMAYRNQYCRTNSPDYHPNSIIAHVKNEHRFGRDKTIHPGYADLILHHLYLREPIFFEVKEESNKTGPMKNGQSEAQIEFEAWCKRKGYRYEIVRSVEEFRAIVGNLGNFTQPIENQ